MKFNKFILISLSVLVFASCEDKIDLELENGISQLVIDGFITNEDTLQTIRLTRSAEYFLNVPTPDENNANVRVMGPNNKVYNFISDDHGNFSYDPTTDGAIDSVGYPYKLEVDYNGSTYTSISILNPVPPIDSIVYDFEEDELGAEEGYYTQFYAKDFAGRKDYYWIKSFRNGERTRFDITDINISEDGAFSGDGADGLVFILPIRAYITDEENPFELGDTNRVELFSINSSVFEYLEQITVQTGNDGLFATTPANIRSNILDAAGNPQNEVLGVFSLSSVSKLEIIIE